MIKTINDLQTIIQSGFTDWESLGRINITEWNGLLLFNYKAEAAFDGEWNSFEMMSRGLIMDAKTGECVALPFAKFFNYGQDGRFPDTAPMEITEKLDGSLGILYRLNGRQRIATRGSFESDQALWATDWLKQYDLSELPPAITLLFEIIYPDNRIVVDYGKREELVLIGARNRNTLTDFFRKTWKEIAWRYRLPYACVYDPQDPLKLTQALNEREELAEGVVVRYADGTRFKFKTETYTRLHYIATQLGFGRVLQEIKAGTFEQFIEGVPDEFLGQVMEHRERIDTVLREVTCEVEEAFRLAPKKDRKTFAIWAKTDAPDLAPYLFMRLDGWDYTAKILQREF